MEETHEFTASELTEAFRKWNKGAQEDTKNNIDRMESEEEGYAEAQTKELLEYLANG